MNNKGVIIGYEERENKNQDTSNIKWYINQCGYDIGKSKRATLVNCKRGNIFYLKNEHYSLKYNRYYKQSFVHFQNLYTVLHNHKKEFL